jgi:hydroxymethylglutaryl-CoA lyase
MILPSSVTIVEVGPRDGLQNEPAPVPVDAKVALVDALSESGLPVIEVGAFVNPTRVPQMADTELVCARIRRRPGTRYVALVPNLVGLDRAMAAGLDDVAIFAAASETFSRKNINQSIDEAFHNYHAVSETACDRGVQVRGYLSTCFGCPYEGAVPVSRIVDLTARLLDMGVTQVAISDTIGIAHPGQVVDVLEAVGARVPLERIALHLHDTRGTALANVLAGLLQGVTTFDTSCGGLGGCPFAPGASGNLAPEDRLYMLDGLGVRTGVRLDAVIAASTAVAARLGHPLPSRYVQAALATTGTLP